ncbi:MAG: SpoIID/LytB domain-containing protein [Candidatus Kuenenia sp.]|nr:SpoIID/LytB domain-containing protein [Candidatus Kuenenia hertensis]
MYKIMGKTLYITVMFVVPFIMTVIPLSCKRDVTKIRDGARDYISRADTTSNVRILLIDRAAKITLAVNGRYQILGSLSNIIDQGIKLDKTTVYIENGRIYIGDRSYYNSELRIKNLEDSGIEVNTVLYRGDIRILQQIDKKFSVIEETEIENFVAGVIGCEMPNAWEEEALRSQAVAIRTYVESKRKAKKNESYHLDKSELAYKGMLGETAKSRKIIQDTAGIVMTYNGEIFSAYFHSTCGGHTEDVNLVFGKEKLPPLAGVKCGYCNNSKYYNWKVNIEKSAIVHKLKKVNGRISGIISVKAINPGPGNHGSEVEIAGANGKERMNANGFRLLVGPNNLYSTAFTAKNNGNSISFSGKGWGHGVGLCQYGAQTMAKKGFNWREILEHYYPKSELMRMY